MVVVVRLPETFTSVSALLGLSPNMAPAKITTGHVSENASTPDDILTEGEVIPALEAKPGCRLIVYDVQGPHT